MKKRFLIISLLVICLVLLSCSSGRGTVVVGAKDFTEQYILGHMLELYIEANTKINVDLKTDMASDVIFAGMRTGVIDIYVEYTGTVYGSYLVRSDSRNPEEVFNVTSTTLLDRYNIHMLEPLGFNNAYHLAVRRDTSVLYDLRTISDLAKVSSDFIIGGSAEFLTRSDGVPNLKLAYGMNFRAERAIDGTDRYAAINNDEIQVTEVFSTDGHLIAYDLVVLEDDLHFFLPYQGAIIIRGEIAEQYPELVTALSKLSGLLTDDIMAALNYRVDVLGESPRDVAEGFLKLNNLI